MQRSLSGSATRTAWTIAGVYFGISVLWIAGSDHVVAALSDDPAIVSHIQTMKGWAFVTVTAGLLWALTYRRFVRLNRATTALDASYRNLASMFNSSPWPLITVNSRAEVTAWNAAATRVFGWAEEEVLGAMVPIMPTDAAVRFDTPWLEATAESGKAVEVICHRGDGQKVVVRISVARHIQAGLNTTGYVIAVKDVTASRTLERLKRQELILREQAQVKNEVIGTIGHELRNPLAVMVATLELINTEAPPPDEQAQLMTMIEESVHQLNHMANNMLEAARMDDPQVRWQWGEVQLEDICSDAVSMMRRLVSRDAVTITHHVTPSDLTMSGDADAIRRLLLNLLSNAIKHVKEGSIFVRVRPTEDDRYVELTVEDTGSGMPPEVVKSLGQAFALNQGSITSDLSRGAGLGLAICRGIVAAHSGTIEVASEVGQGTRFTIRLARGLEKPSAAMETAITNAVFRREGANIAT